VAKTDVVTLGYRYQDVKRREHGQNVLDGRHEPHDGSATAGEGCQCGRRDGADAERRRPTVPLHVARQCAAAGGTTSTRRSRARAQTRYGLPQALYGTSSEAKLITRRLSGEEQRLGGASNWTTGPRGACRRQGDRVAIQMGGRACRREVPNAVGARFVGARGNANVTAEGTLTIGRGLDGGGGVVVHRQGTRR